MQAPCLYTQPLLFASEDLETFSGRDKEEVSLRQEEVGRNVWRETTLVTSVGFTFSCLASTPVTPNKVLYGKAKV